MRNNLRRRPGLPAIAALRDGVPVLRIMRRMKDEPVPSGLVEYHDNIAIGGDCHVGV